MTPVLSGGLVYEYSEETSDYGLVTINGNGSAQLLPDFDTLQSQFNTLNVTALQGLKAQNTSVEPPTCAASLISSSSFNSNFTIPSVPPGAQDLINNGISPKPSGSIVSVTGTKVTQVGLVSYYFVFMFYKSSEPQSSSGAINPVCSVS